MTLHVDHYYTIGKTHSVCEDYAISSPEPIAHAIISDGCSSSSSTDMGARIISFAARQFITNFMDQHESPPNLHAMGRYVAAQARATSATLSLPDNSIDATLIVALQHKNELHIVMFGDGFVITKDLGGHIRLFEISYENNAPYYLSYETDPRRRSIYRNAASGIDSDLNTKLITQHNDHRSCTTRYDQPSVFKFDLDQYRYISIASDGLSSFFNQSNGDSIDPVSVSEKLLSYKTNTGSFVKRRSARMLKEFSKQNIFHADDFSIATFARNEG